MCLSLLLAVSFTKTISKNLHVVIREWISKNSFKGKSKKALEELPETLQYFYNDYKGRSSVFDAWGNYSWTLLWIGVLGMVTYLFSLVER